MEIICPKCGSSNVYLNQKGYSATKGVLGALLTGNLLGLAGGFAGSKKITCNCLSCGYKFDEREAREFMNDRKVNERIISDYEPSSYEQANPSAHLSLPDDELLKELVKEALDAEFNDQWDMASVNWDICIEHLYNSGMDLDNKIVNKAISCAREHGNPFRLMCVYENLISKWPTHPDAQSWQESLNKLEENPFG